MNSIGFILPQLVPTNPLRWIPPPPAAAGGGRGLSHHLHHQQQQRRRRLSLHSYRRDQAAATTDQASTTSSTVDDTRTKSPSPRSTMELADRPRHPNSALPLFLEERLEKIIYRCRFLTAFGIVGSLMGSILCFLEGCAYIFDSFVEYYVRGGGQVILLMVQAIDVYLIGTVMFVFGMGLYELFISNLDIAKTSSHRSNFLGLFKLSARPKWLEIQSVNELKTKLGHVIVMVLLVGLFEKSKKVTISTTTDLLCFAASILLSSTCLYLLSKLQSSKQSKHAR
ncbi:uncharacterized protein M6B38_392700 [Iris pallida]|uniref:Uncharacterized protein n=1 Tax=Iris pallida TaxID=29817 RepID=A0AAX6FXY0_IRIPA|nr:uncharacterized protein M6B38_392700 [Iris pallida]